MASKVCSDCGKKIRFLSKLAEKNCDSCGSPMHATCGNYALDFQSFEKGACEKKCFCKKCNHTNSNNFGEKKSCNYCGADITTASLFSLDATRCEGCGEIGHKSCLHNFSVHINDELFYLYPYAHNKSKHRHICQECSETLLKKIAKIKSGYDHWVSGTRNEFIRGYRTLKNLGRIEYDRRDCKDPSELEAILKLFSIQLGGNAFVKFYWDKKIETNTERELAGYSDAGNPYYKTVYNKEKWFTGYAYAVYVEPFKKKKRND